MLEDKLQQNRSATNCINEIFCWVTLRKKEVHYIVLFVLFFYLFHVYGISLQTITLYIIIITNLKIIYKKQH